MYFAYSFGSCVMVDLETFNMKSIALPAEISPKVGRPDSIFCIIKGGNRWVTWPYETICKLHKVLRNAAGPLDVPLSFIIHTKIRCLASGLQGDVQLCKDICPDQHFYIRCSIENPLWYQIKNQLTMSKKFWSLT